MSRKIINTSDAPISVRYMTKTGKDGEIKTVDIGAKADLGVVGRAQPEVVVSDTVWDKIKDKIDGYVGVGLDDRPLRVTAG